MTYYTYKDSPIGKLLLVRNDKILTGLYFTSYKNAPTPRSDWLEDTSRFEDVSSQLDEYLNGTRKTFDIPFQQNGTEFQKQVWSALERIPYGVHKTYKDIAESIGKPKAVRAVGTAIGSNPVCVIGPCHRVIATSGGLGGYAGGLEAKTFLLKLETQ